MQRVVAIFSLLFISSLVADHGNHDHHHHHNHHHDHESDELDQAKGGGGKLALPNLKDCTNSEYFFILF